MEQLLARKAAGGRRKPYRRIHQKGLLQPLDSWHGHRLLKFRLWNLRELLPVSGVIPADIEIGKRHCRTIRQCKRTALVIVPLSLLGHLDKDLPRSPFRT